MMIYHPLKKALNLIEPGIIPDDCILYQDYLYHLKGNGVGGEPITEKQWEALADMGAFRPMYASNVKHAFENLEQKEK